MFHENASVIMEVKEEVLQVSVSPHISREDRNPRIAGKLHEIQIL